MPFSFSNKLNMKNGNTTIKDPHRSCAKIFGKLQWDNTNILGKFFVKVSLLFIRHENKINRRFLGNTLEETQNSPIHHPSSTSKHHWSVQISLPMDQWLLSNGMHYSTRNLQRNYHLTEQMSRGEIRSLSVDRLPKRKSKILYTSCKK